MTRDQNGQRVIRNVRKERTEEGQVWGVNVWFSGIYGPATTLSRRYYRTRRQAMQGDIGHAHGDHGCVGTGSYRED